MKMHQLQRQAYIMASEEKGLRELRGPENNPSVVQFFADVGHGWVKDDETAWCAAFVGAMLERAGLRSTRALNARSYLEWGQEISLEDAKVGDVLVFWRNSPDDWRGHVGFFVNRAGTHLEVLGGNQSDAVTVQRYPVSRLLSVRRMPADEDHVPQTRVPVLDAQPPRPVKEGPLVKLINRLFSFLSKGGPA